MNHYPKTVALLYCRDNEDIAQHLIAELAGVVHFQTFSAGKDDKSSIASQFANFHGPTVLLVSDNFLRSTGCMHQGLTLLNGHHNEVLPVIVPGKQMDANGQTVTVETSIERVTDIIQYINFWQDRYLDLRKHKREDEGMDTPDFNQHLGMVREISGEAGEFIRLLRNVWNLNWLQFSYNHYEQLFIFLEAEDLGQRFRDEQARKAPVASPVAPVAEAPTVEEPAPVDIADIPGMDLLEQDTPSAPEDVLPEPQEPAPSMAEVEPEIVAEEPPAIEAPSAPIQEETTAEAEATIPEPIMGASTAQQEVTTTAEEDDVEEYIGKCWVLFDQNAAESALDVLELGLQQYPKNPELRFNKALLLAELERYDEAKTEVEAVLDMLPENQDALFLAGEIADAQEDGALAKQYFEDLTALNEDYAEAWLKLGQINQYYYPDKAEESARYFTQAITLQPALSEAAYELGGLYANHLGNEEQAERWFKRTIATDPRHPLAHYELAVLSLNKGEKAQAAAYYQNAIQITPALDTPDNRLAFELPVADTPHDEQDALAALKANIAQLEQMLAQRSAKTAQEHALEPEPAPITAPVKTPGPGKGRCALITGATSGIGLATARTLAEEDYDLIITGRRQERLDAIAEELRALGSGEVLALPFDVRDYSACEQAINSLPSDWRDIDVLINNAGKAKGFAPIQEGSLQHWEEMIDTNVKGLLYMSRLVTPGMVAKGSGHVLNICSTAGKEVYPNGNVYCATKTAVDALTRAMRLDLHQHGVRVSQVSPAHVEETEFALVRFDGDEARANIYEGFKPLNARDVAETISFILRQPTHVNILDIVLQGTQQASSTLIDRSGREKYNDEEE